MFETVACLYLRRFQRGFEAWCIWQYNLQPLSIQHHSLQNSHWPFTVSPVPRTVQRDEEKEKGGETGLGEQSSQTSNFEEKHLYYEVGGSNIKPSQEPEKGEVYPYPYHSRFASLPLVPQELPQWSKVFTGTYCSRSFEVIVSRSLYLPWTLYSQSYERRKKLFLKDSPSKASIL